MQKNKPNNVQNKIFKEFKNWQFDYDSIIVDKPDLYLLTTFRPNKNLLIHNWYPYLQGYSADLVKYLLQEFDTGKNSVIVDPWVGVGTTNIVCNNHGIRSIGIDISPLAVFVSKVKCVGIPDSKILEKYNDKLFHSFNRNNFKSSNHFSKTDFLARALPAKVIDKVILLRRDILKIKDKSIRDFFFLALLSSLNDISLIQKDGAHYRFREIPLVKDVWKAFSSQVNQMRGLNNNQSLELYPIDKHKNLATILEGDSRKLPVLSSVADFIITSPPYLNRDNYIAQNKLELLFGNFVNSFEEYRFLTHRTLRSHVEAKSFEYKQSVSFPFIKYYTDELITRKHLLNNSKVLEMINGYFVDIDLSLAEICRILKPKGKAAIVIANSSWAGVHLEVDKIIAELGNNRGLLPLKIWVTRHKLNSAQQIVKFGKTRIRESIVILQKQ